MFQIDFEEKIDRNNNIIDGCYSFKNSQGIELFTTGYFQKEKLLMSFKNILTLLTNMFIVVIKDPNVSLKLNN